MQENSPIQSDSPNLARSSTETTENILINDQRKSFFGKISSRNNHYYESNNNRLRLSTRRLFKFRRKKSFNPIKQNFNNNNYHNIIQDNPPKINIEQILNHQWIQTLDKNYYYSHPGNKQTEIPLMNNAIDDRYVFNEPKQDKQSKSPENTLRHSPNAKNKRLLTKDIMSGKFL